MPWPVSVFAACALVGVAVGVASLAWMRAIGASPGMARRLAGAQGMGVADLSDLTTDPARPVRVAGRIRCPRPMVGPDGEQLVVYHRDVAVRLPSGRWRTIERIRETRSFELWDHAGAVALDPRDAAEPIVSIPLVWEGAPDELGESHRPAVERLRAEGEAPTAARAVTRLVSVVDRPLVLAQVRLDAAGRPHLEPPPGGYIISTVELPAAMRLLGGLRRQQLAAAIITLAVGAILVGIGVAGIVVAAMTR